MEGSFAKLHQRLREAPGWVSPGTVACTRLLAPSIPWQKTAQKPVFASLLYRESACCSHVFLRGDGNHFNCFQGGTDRGMCPSCWLIRGQKQKQGTQRVSFLPRELRVNPSKPGDSSQSIPHASYCTIGVSGSLAVFANLVRQRVKCWPLTEHQTTQAPSHHSAFMRKNPSQPCGFFFSPSPLLPQLFLLSPTRFTALSCVQHPNKSLTNCITGLGFATSLQMPARLWGALDPPSNLEPVSAQH